MPAATIFEAFGIAITTLSHPYVLLTIVLATILGLFMGVIPGLGGPTALALLIPLTFNMDSRIALMVLAAATGGTAFGGSLTAILINTPGTAPNAATLLDGYPMTKQGRAGEAIGASAIASAMGAIFGIVILILSMPILLQAILWFGPAEIFLLGLWGLSIVSIVVKGNVTKGLISAALGLLFAMHGISGITAQMRWTYGLTFMQDGVKLIPPIVGLFAVAEMIDLMAKNTTISNETDNVEIEGKVLDGVRSVFIHKWIFLRSALIGTLVGIIPGVGGTAANYIAYFTTSQSASDSENFGKGDIRGVISSEASNDAKDGGSLIPTLGFGIPGSATTAILLGAFVLHGITPGPVLMQENLDIVGVIIVALVVANILTSLIGLMLTKRIVTLTNIDIVYVAPVVIILSLFGSFAVQNNVFNIFITLFFGLLGFLMITIKMARVPMILGIVLGPIVENNFWRALQLSSGDPVIFVSSPVSIVLLFLLVASLIVPKLDRFSPGEYQ